jgi:uncharacterized membrane protein
VERIAQAITFVAALGTGLVGGLFFVFSVTIMAALGKLSPATGIAAMQSINVTIVNGAFLSVFMGTAMTCVALIVGCIFGWVPAGSTLVLAASLLYLVGVIGVTALFNVPMNNALEAVRPDSAEGASLWQDYLARWTLWNHVRTLAGIGASALFILAFRA